MSSPTPSTAGPTSNGSAGFRTTLGVPMLVEDEVVGVLSLWRRDVDPFSDRAIELVTTFAAQAAIAIRNVDLVRALQSRTTELAVKVEQLEALRQIGQAVSSSLDLDDVLTTIVTHSVQLTDTDGGSLLEYDDDVARVPHPRRLRHEPAAAGGAAEHPDHLGRHARRPGLPGGSVAQCPRP